MPPFFISTMQIPLLDYLISINKATNFKALLIHSNHQNKYEIKDDEL